ncbi:MAG: hypothetical protein IPQ28_01985 [Sphingobacteriales bacterium]|nr:hypothetical protein [Sphingobacteriales bacterium]
MPELLPKAGATFLFLKTITIPPGQQEVEFIIDGIKDGLAEGAESIVINFNLPLGCDTVFFQTATLNNEDLVPLTASADQTLIEPGTIVTLSATEAAANTNGCLR